MDPTHDKLKKVIIWAQEHVSKILIALSGVTILVSGYFTYDYKQYTDCQVQLQEDNRITTQVFAESLRTLLAQPPRPQAERIQAFQKLQAALDHQEAAQRELGDCK